MQTITAPYTYFGGKALRTLTGPILEEAASLLHRLVEEPTFLDLRVLPILERADRAEDWYVACRHDASDGSSLQVFVWSPGSKTRIHDHSCGGAFCCVVGSLREERYERFDDGSKESRARLRKLWERMWNREEGVSAVLPYDGGIHRVENAGESVAISIHIYGPRMGEIDGRDYHPSWNYVCDRQET